MTMADRFAIKYIPYNILVGRDGKVISVGKRGDELKGEVEKLFAD
jgi:hypothetical protein